MFYIFTIVLIKCICVLYNTIVKYEKDKIWIRQTRKAGIENNPVSTVAISFSTQFMHVKVNGDMLRRDIRKNLCGSTVSRLPDFLTIVFCTNSDRLVIKAGFPLAGIFYTQLLLIFVTKSAKATTEKSDQV